MCMVECMVELQSTSGGISSNSGIVCAPSLTAAVSWAEGGLRSTPCARLETPQALHKGYCPPALRQTGVSAVV